MSSWLVCVQLTEIVMAVLLSFPTEHSCTRLTPQGASRRMFFNPHAAAHHLGYFCVRESQFFVFLHCADKEVGGWPGLLEGSVVWDVNGDCWYGVEPRRMGQYKSSGTERAYTPGGLVLEGTLRMYIQRLVQSYGLQPWRVSSHVGTHGQGVTKICVDLVYLTEWSLV